MTILSQIFLGYEYGIDFLDENDELVEEMLFSSQAERLEAYTAVSSSDNDPLWPDGSVTYQPWEKEITRQAIYGLDYGPGSQKARFGGGYVPRSCYQFGGS